MKIKQIVYSKEEPNIVDIQNMIRSTNSNTYDLVYNPKISMWELILWII